MFYDQLFIIKERPNLFSLGSVEEIEAFITGIDMGRKMYQCPDDKEFEDFISGFNEWVRNYHSIESHQGWAKIIRFFSSDDAYSVEYFFRLLQEYYERRKE